MSHFNPKDMTKGSWNLTIVSLIILNIGIFNLFEGQLSLHNQTVRNISVKDAQIAIPPVGNISQNNTIEPLTSSNDKPIITTYVVVAGDTLSGIANQFNVSTNTILWANDLTSKSKISIGQKLTILPVTGIEYKVAKGDTLSGIAYKFKADVDEIASFNNLDDNHKIKIGDKLIIPDAEPIIVPKKETKKITTPVTQNSQKEIPTTNINTSVPQPTTNQTGTDNISTSIPVPSPTETKENTNGYFTNPIPGSHLSQGLHGYNSVDFGAPVGTPVLAAADGTVIIAKSSGFNGGYGYYMVLSHPNGTQTLYAHLSKLNFQAGDTVKQGEQIALSGRTGRVTGPHLHFEVRGGVNPWVGDKLGTEY